MNVIRRQDIHWQKLQSLRNTNYTLSDEQLADIKKGDLSTRQKTHAFWFARPTRDWEINASFLVLFTLQSPP